MKITVCLQCLGKEGKLKKNKLVGVYEVVNTINGMRIIGSSVDIIRRWSNYKSKLKKGTYGNQGLQQAFNKHGLDKFEFNVLEIVSNKADLFTREQFYQSEYEEDELYNIRGIKNTNKKVRTKAEAIALSEKMSEVNSGENNPRHSGKLKTSDIVRIKTMFEEGLSNKEVHSEFEDKTTYNMISKIRTGNRYSSVKIPEPVVIKIKHYVDDVRDSEEVVI